jgi:hydrogenase maturation protease
MSERALIVGIGSDFGDDQAGLIAAQQLEQELGIVAVRQLRSPAGLLDLVDGCDELHIIDACHGAGEPGSIVRMHWPSPALTAHRFSGTHDLDLVGALRLADELRLLPPRVTIWAIDAGASAGEPLDGSLSAEVSVAIDQLVIQLVAEVEVEARHA